MQIIKHYQSRVELDYFYIEGKLNIDSNYYIQKIEQGIQEKDNKNFDTNVRGFMTDYKFFKEDPMFFKILNPMLDYLEDNVRLKNKYNLFDAWGLKNVFGNFTKEHDHQGEAVISGLIYLNNSSQSLKFSQINQTLNAIKGNFALFSPFLLHKTNKRINEFDDVKYAIAFNLNRV